MPDLPRLLCKASARSALIYRTLCPNYQAFYPIYQTIDHSGIERTGVRSRVNSQRSLMAGQGFGISLLAIQFAGLGPIL